MNISGNRNYRSTKPIALVFASLKFFNKYLAISIANIFRKTPAVNSHEAPRSTGIARFSLSLTLLMMGLCVLTTPAKAKVCNNIGSLPFVINVPGTYCLSTNLQYLPSSGNAVNVKADDVTIKLSGGKIIGNRTVDTKAVGIFAIGVSNLSILGAGPAGGSIEHFLKGIHVHNSRNIRINNVSLRDSHYIGIDLGKNHNVDVSNSVIERTGGTSAFFGKHAELNGIGIRVFGGSDVVIQDNQVGLTTRTRIDGRYGIGMAINSPEAKVLNNLVVNSQNIGILTNWGLDSTYPGLAVHLEGNRIINRNDWATHCHIVRHEAIRMSGLLDTYANNTVQGFHTPFLNGTDAGGNAHDAGPPRICP